MKLHCRNNNSVADSHDKHRGNSRPKRGAVLLLTLLVWASLTIVVAQMDTSSFVALEQAFANTQQRQCRRALDSVPGIVSRMLTETGADRSFDSLEDHWALPKVFTFDIGQDDQLTLTVSISDISARYDLKGLLDENPDRARAAAEDFIEFAEAGGLDSFSAAEIANSILNEAIHRRAEDQAVMDEIQAEGGTAQQPLPLWLDDFLDLPTVSDETRRAFRAAYTDIVDPATGETIRVRLADQITSWRVGPPNVNTAGLLVLANSGSELRDIAEMIYEKRAEEPFRTIAQVQLLAAPLTADNNPAGGGPGGGSDGEAAPGNEEAISSTIATVASTRFEVRAEAVYQKQAARLRLIVERNAQGAITILWRRGEP